MVTFTISSFLKPFFSIGLLLCSIGFMTSNALANEPTTRPGKMNLNSLETLNNGVTLKIRPLKLVLGQPFTIYIEGEKLGKSSALLDWSHLKTAFRIENVEQHSSSLRITAYPYKAQRFTLQEQNAGLIHIPKTQIDVAQNPDVKIDWQAPPRSLYSAQQALWTAHVTVTNPAFLVEIKPIEDLKNESVITRVLSSENQLLPKMVRYEMPSILTPENIELKSPVIEVKNTSNRRWKFYDYAQKIAIKPLPIFLPMSVAVGQMHWHIMPVDKVYQEGNLYYWNWQLTGQGVSADYMKSTANELINQLTHNAQFSWLAESIKVTQSANDKGLVTKLNIQVPFRIKQPGLVNFPRLVLRSFNPQSAKVEQQVFASVKTVALPSWLMWLFKWAILLFVLVVGYLILVILKQQWLNNHLRKEIVNAQSSQAILQSIMYWQKQHVLAKKTDNQQANQQAKIKSLRQLKEWHAYHYGLSEPLETLLNNLNALLYSRNQQAVSFEQVQQNALNWTKSLSLLAVTKDVINQTIKQGFGKLNRLRNSK